MFKHLTYWLLFNQCTFITRYYLKQKKYVWKKTRLNVVLKITDSITKKILQMNYPVHVVTMSLRTPLPGFVISNCCSWLLRPKRKIKRSMSSLTTMVSRLKSKHNFTIPQVWTKMYPKIQNNTFFDFFIVWQDVTLLLLSLDKATEKLLHNLKNVLIYIS